jgi:hypothetical protein
MLMANPTMFMAENKFMTQNIARRSFDVAINHNPVN